MIRTLCARIAVASGLFFGGMAAAAPLGHPDFYPSADHPIGYRGDGTGYFPGASPVTSWSEGTPVQKVMPYKDQWGNPKTMKMWDFSDDKTTNIVWKIQLPSWANTQPIVVGDRIFTTGEPDLLFCVDANTGKILWTAENNVWELAGVDAPAAKQCHDLYELKRALLPLPPRMIPPPAICNIFTEKCLARIVEALKTSDPQGQWDAPAATMRAAVESVAKDPNKEMEKHERGRFDTAWTALATAIDKRIIAISGKKLPTDNTWGNMVGFAMSVPVSDGQSIYASFGQGQTVCYDLQGKRIWGRQIDHEQKSRTSQIQSPLLAGNVLVDMHGGPELLRGLDKKTGKTLWEAPTLGKFDFGKGGGYYVGGHKIVRIADELYVVTVLCNIIRARDGKVVGVLPFDAGGAFGGPSISCGGKDGDIVLKSSNGDNYSTPIVAYRLKPDGPDKVVAQKLWQTTDEGASPGYHGQVFTPQWAILTSSAGNVIDLETGVPLCKPSRREGVGKMSNILAGNTMFWLPEGSNDRGASFWDGRRVDGKVMVEGFAADLSNPKAPKGIPGVRMLGGANIPHVPAMEKYAPELYANGDYFGNWHWYGKPAHFVQVDTAWMPMGNRLFLRTVGHLYCIGDPAVPYNWNPKSRP